MFKKYAKKLLRLFPKTLQIHIQKVHGAYSRKLILKKWVDKGSPIPPPHEVKQLTIENYQKKFKIRFFVETGTYLGTMIYAQRNNFEKIYSVELGIELWENATKKFQEFSHIELMQGDSGKILKKIMPRLKSKAIFWLDGHYSGGITAKGEKICPIYEELDAIFNNNSFNHIILIDDAFLFNGTDDYPTLPELKKFISEKKWDYSLQVKHGIIILTSRDNYLMDSIRHY